MSERTRFTALFDPLTFARVSSLAAIRKQPTYRVINDAVEAYYGSLSDKEREEVDYLVEIWEVRAKEHERIRGKKK